MAKKSKWKLKKVGKNRYRVRHTDTDDYTKTVYSKEEAQDWKDQIEPTLKYDDKGKLIVPKKVVAQSPKTQKQSTFTDTTAAQKFLHKEAQADSATKANLFDDNYQSLIKARDALDRVVPGPTAEQEKKILTKRIRDLESAVGITSIDSSTTNIQAPVTGKGKKGFWARNQEKQNFINKRKDELKAKYMTMYKNKAELPDHIRPGSMTLDAKRQAIKEWEEMENNPAGLDLDIQ